MKPPFLNTMFKPCCYRQQNSYKVYKWIPNDPTYDKTNGETGKRIMKIKEQSSYCQRCLVPASCRGYDGYFIAENNRKVVFQHHKDCQPTLLCCKRPQIDVNILDQELETKTSQENIEPEEKRLNEEVEKKLAL